MNQKIYREEVITKQLKSTFSIQNKNLRDLDNLKDYQTCNELRKQRNTSDNHTQ